MTDTDELYSIIITIICIIGWIALGGAILAMPTELPNGCILYEDVIWCEVNE